MKKKMILRIFGIGILHAVLYLYIVPFVMYPKFGSKGIIFAVIVAVIISMAAFGTMLLERKLKGDKNE